ncbi:hypothetical protein VCHENC02_4394A, partial [Vibrio harveyi]
MHKDLYL